MQTILPHYHSESADAEYIITYLTHTWPAWSIISLLVRPSLYRIRRRHDLKGRHMHNMKTRNLYVCLFGDDLGEVDIVRWNEKGV